MLTFGSSPRRVLVRDQAEAGRAVAERRAEDRHVVLVRLVDDAVGVLQPSLLRGSAPIARMNSRDEYGRGSRSSTICRIVSSQMRSSSSSISVS